MNADSQADEVETLKAIYDENFKVVDHVQHSYAVGVYSDDDHIISLELLVTFPSDYPSHSPPIYEIRNAPWLNGQQLEVIHKQLIHLFHQNPGEVVVYQWVEWLREFVSEKAKETQLPSLPTSTTTQSCLNSSASYRATFGDESDGNQEAIVEMETPAVVHGEPLMDRKSTFQAHAAQVKTAKEVKEVLSELKQNKKIANATHNILAYRIQNPSNGTFQQDCDDDGESAAGGRLLHLLQIMDARDVMVVVTRWYGGIQLHADRFKHINNVARVLLTESGLGLTHKEDSAAKDIKFSKTKGVGKSKTGRHR